MKTLFEKKLHTNFDEEIFGEPKESTLEVIVAAFLTVVLVAIIITAIIMFQ